MVRAWKSSAISKMTPKRDPRQESSKKPTEWTYPNRVVVRVGSRLYLSLKEHYYYTFYASFSILVSAIGLTSVLTLKGQLIELERLLDEIGENATATGAVKPGE